MQAYPSYQGKLSNFAKIIFGTMTLLVSSMSHASPIIITGNHVITTPTVYQNVVLDMSNGRFTINAGGSLTIENSIVNSTISPSNPYMVSLTTGGLSLKNSKVTVTESGIVPDMNSKSAYPLIKVAQGQVSINDNTFANTTAFTVGFLETQNLETHGFDINHNLIKNFHGGLYLENSNNAEVDDNSFEMVSYSNIINVSSNASKFKRNIFSFPGNLKKGNAFNIINSKGLDISDNIITNSAGTGIFIMGGQKLFIDNNQISDGKSFGIYIQTPSLTSASKNPYYIPVLAKNLKLASNSNIVISNNYIAQNRYGLSGGEIDHLIVTNNIFIQRFQDNSTRQNWTNNDVLLASAADLIWSNNLYKEAFTQEVPGDNSNTLQFVTFPEHGGVFLP